MPDCTCQSGPDAASRPLGHFLLRAMPVLLALLSSVGTLAMLWVGGGILLHGAHELGLHGPPISPMQCSTRSNMPPARWAACWAG